MTVPGTFRRLFAGSGTTRLDRALALFNSAIDEIQAAADKLNDEACTIEDQLAALQYQQSQILEREQQARRVVGRLKGILR